MGTKFVELTELTSLASGDVLAVVDVSDTTDSAEGTSKRITAANVATGLASIGAFALDSELTAHEADTTSVHGIADTSVLATATSVATAVSNHAAAVDPHADRAYADTVGNLKLAKASNLSDLANAATARTNLGLAAIAASGSASDLSAGTVPSARLGTGGAGLGAKVLADNQTFIDLPTGTVGGSLGSTDNVVPRTSGTGGSTLEGTGVLIDDNNRVTAGAGSTGGVNFGSAGARILDSNNDGRLDFVAGGSSRMDLVDMGGGSYRLRMLSSGGISSAGQFRGTGLNFNEDAGIERNAAGECVATNSAGTLANFRAKNFAITVGSNVASATTISPTNALFHLTGTTPVQTINVPYSGFTGCIHLIPDGAGTLITGGNVAIGVTLVVGRLLTLAWDGTSWYPSYI